MLKSYAVVQKAITAGQWLWNAAQAANPIGLLIAGITALIAAGAASGITVGTAAELCNSSTNNGQTDWYLPSIDELSKLWQNKWDFAQGINLAAGTQISFSAYWSSTEHGVNTAWNFNFNNGDATNGSKGSTYYVRAVRTFGV